MKWEKSSQVIVIWLHLAEVGGESFVEPLEGGGMRGAIYRTEFGRSRSGRGPRSTAAAG